MRRELIGILTAAALFAALALCAGALGPVLPQGDSFAVFRGEAAVFLGLLALLLWALRAPRRAVGFGCLALGALGSLAPYWLSAPANASAGPGIALYQKNVSYRLIDNPAIAADIVAAAPEIVTLQEVTPQNRAVLDLLPEDYVTRHHCPRAGLAVASIYPAIPGTALCTDPRGLAAITVETPQGPLRILSLHLHWPWPDEQAPQVARLMETLQAGEAPTVLGGDFNMVRWSHTLHRIARATGTRPVGRPTATLPAPGLLMGGLAIDHVLAPEPGTVETRPRLGSDHLGLLARFRL